VTYDSLRDSIKTWASNNDPEFLAELDTFISQAENVIFTSVRLPKFSTVTTLSATPSTATIAVPADFLSADSLSPASGVPLLKKDPEFIYECYPDSSITGPPRFFALLDDQTILLGPTPDLAYSYRLRYFNRPVSIVALRSGTYVSTNFEAALLNGSLMFAAMFMKAQDEIASYQTAFINALGLSSAFAKGRFMKQTFERESAAVTSDELK
jgi:hypothetical protein